MAEMILVPRVAIPTPRVYGSTPKENGLGVTPVHVHIDPINVFDIAQQYRDWYGCSFPLTVSKEQIERKFWSHADFVKTVRASPADYVLVHSTHYSGWTLEFPEWAHYHAFNTQLNAARLEFEIEMPNGWLTDEAAAWLKEHVRQPWKQFWHTATTQIVALRDPDEAAFFKLRWFGGLAK